ncbi:sodium/iodide cotransporter [Drosophila mojavensis]|uniref:sodium/iodide cotransporter n=1 Tax=Drosophila mojavensis TaxID=7230 RepID=UPI0013EED5DC|nr:sodium/iodide cotransporter [Drosophila mojavensis]
MPGSAASAASATMVNSAATSEMEELRFSITDYSIFLLLLSVSAAIGLYFGFYSKSRNTTDEYLRGGKKLHALPIAISLVSSQLSGVSIMSIPAESYTFGFNFIFGVLAMLPTMSILIYIMVPIFYDNNVANCYEYLEMRFNKGTLTGVNIHLINITVSSICVFYTMLGGIKAVVWTDVVQGGVMLMSVIMVAILGTIRTGGLATVLDYASEGGRMDIDFRLDPRIRSTIWNCFSSGLLLWTGKIGVDQSCVQRIVSLPSFQEAKKSLVVAGFGFMTIMTLTYFTGIIMFARYFGCDPMLAGLVSKPDKMMPFFIQDIMGKLPGMPGLFISCVFSASLSSLSANLNSLAGVVYFDYIKPHIRHTEARANGCMKLVVVAMGVYCILGGIIVQHFNSILQTMWTVTGINTGAVVGVFLLGMFVPRVNGKVAMTSIIFSVLTMLWLIINAMMNIKAGLIKYEVLPNSLDQCEARGFHAILAAINHTTTTPATAIPLPVNVTTAFDSNREFSIFDISFYWYKMIGAILIFVCAVPLSYIWRPDKNDKLNPKLYSPFVRNMLNVSEPEVELEEVPLKGREGKRITVIHKLS